MPRGIETMTAEEEASLREQHSHCADAAEDYRREKLRDLPPCRECQWLATIDALRALVVDLRTSLDHTRLCHVDAENRARKAEDLLFLGKSR
jgi:hypothetical protein